MLAGGIYAQEQRTEVEKGETALLPGGAEGSLDPADISSHIPGIRARYMVMLRWSERKLKKAC